MNILSIGLGNMGSAIVTSLINKHTVYAVDPYASSKTHINPNITVYSSLSEASSAINKEIDIILIAVKPQIVADVLSELSKYLSSSTMIISTVVGINIEYIARTLNNKNIVRIMPTIAAKEKESLTAISFHPELDNKKMQDALNIAKSFGKVLPIKETQMSAITGISGSGIAFVALFIESLTMAGVREGLSYQDAYQTTLQTIKGALTMLESQDTSPSEFISTICSPGGTTIEGIHALHKEGMPSSIFSAVRAASEKSNTFNKKN